MVPVELVANNTTSTEAAPRPSEVEITPLAWNMLSDPAVAGTAKGYGQRVGPVTSRGEHDHPVEMTPVRSTAVHESVRRAGQWTGRRGKADPSGAWRIPRGARGRRWILIHGSAVHSDGSCWRAEGVGFLYRFLYKFRRGLGMGFLHPGQLQ